MKKYPRDEIPFPVRPGDTVYHLRGGDEGVQVVAEVAHAVGVDDDGRLFVLQGDTCVPIGAEGRCFRTADDARAFAEDEASLARDYGTIEYGMLDLPFYPGDELFFPDYDPVFDRWQIIVSICTQVVFNEDGTVDVTDDTGGEARIVGERQHSFCAPTFDTARKARNYVKKQGYGSWKS